MIKQHSISQKLLCLVLLALPFIGFGQNRQISGTVVETRSGKALPGVSIVVQGTTRGAITDADGRYNIQASSSDTLLFSFIGYRSKTQRVGDRSEINIELLEDVTSLEEVVVVGYGTSTKKELTGAAAKVKGENIEKMNIPRMDQALQGQVAGVTINTNSGSPGGGSNIRIRGLSTFGDNDPLILVDGIVYDSEGLNALNPSDIESINVLKDATAGIYGVRAANGVILIETKKGKANAAPQIELNGYYGIQQPANKLDLLNAQEYAVIKNQAFANGNDPLPFSNTNLGVGTDWQDSVFQNAPVQNWNLSISGGTGNTRYSVGGSYFSQKGIVGGDKASFERLNGRVNISTDLSDKLKLNSVFLYTNEERNALPENGIGSVLYNTVNAYPTEPVRQADGRYSYLDLVSDIINPLAQMENTYNTSWVNKFVGKEELEWKLTDDFTFTNRLSYNYADVETKVFSPLVWYGPGKAQNTAANADLDPVQVEIADSVLIDRGASVYEAQESYIDLTFESFLNYAHVFNEVHSLKGTLGASVFRRTGESLNATAYNIPNNSVEYADISANLAPGGFLNNAGSWEFEERLLSTFLRAEYGYKQRYLVSAILRRDGSSKFGPNNRYGFFPTFSGAWIISEEGFYDIEPIGFAKLRLSYGFSGNDQIANFAYRALLNGEGVYVWDDVITSGVAVGRASNPDLKWESTRQFNIGLDLSVLRSLDVTANYFVKNTYDLLFQPDVSGVLGSYGPGGFPPIINAGDVTNRGLELELNYFTDPGKDLSFTAGYNVTMLTNEVLRVPEGVDFLPGADFGVGGNVATRFEEGFPIGYFIGFETDGIFQTQQEIDDAPVEQQGARPGDLRFVDQDGDGEISFSDDSDRVMIGSPIPDFTMGLNLTLRYKAFDVSANVYAALGQEIIRNYERQQPFANQLDYWINRWTGPGSSTEVPRVTTGSTRNNVFSDFYVEDGSFARLRNVQLGFTLPLKWMKTIGLGSCRVYVAANNMVTLTGYRGYDPDIGSVGGTLSSGVDYGFYPQARTIMGGFNLKF